MFLMVERYNFIPSACPPESGTVGAQNPTTLPPLAAGSCGRPQGSCTKRTTAPRISLAPLLRRIRRREELAFCLRFHVWNCGLPMVAIIRLHVVSPRIEKKLGAYIISAALRQFLTGSFLGPGI